MVDCGNVTDLESLESLIRDLIINLPHSVIMVVGGTDEVNMGVVRGMAECGGVRMVKVDSAIDMGVACVKQEYKDAPIVTNKLHHFSYFRMIVEDT